LGLEYAEISKLDKGHGKGKRPKSRVDGHRKSLVVCQNLAAVESACSDLRGVGARE
jgi:hypothetical protein